MSGRETRAATSPRGRKLGGMLLRNTDAVLLPEREARAGQALAIAFPLIRLAGSASTPCLADIVARRSGIRSLRDRVRVALNEYDNARVK